jgi:cobalamin synthase
MKGAIVFAVVMMLIGPTTRHLLSGRLGAFGDWLGAWSPISYVIVAVVLAAPIAAAQMMLTWPKHVVPESPMAKYRREAPEDVE